jgi:hypothetical protein
MLNSWCRCISIDGFVGHVHLRAVGEVSAQSARNLLRTPLLVQMVLHDLAQHGMGCQFAHFRAGPACISTPLRRIWTVLASTWMAVASDFPTDGRRAARKLLGNHPIAGLLT